MFISDKNSYLLVVYVCAFYGGMCRLKRCSVTGSATETLFYGVMCRLKRCSVAGCAAETLFYGGMCRLKRVAGLRLKRCAMAGWRLKRCAMAG